LAPEGYLTDSDQTPTIRALDAYDHDAPLHKTHLLINEFDILETGLNPYDVRKKCDRSKDGDLCYRQMGWIETWMNDPKHKVALGVDPERTFTSCNMEVNQAFMLQGDGMHNSAALLPDLVNDGIRLLVYAGNAGK
jgi:carboxypeptidase C (cathepsin A)